MKKFEYKRIYSSLLDFEEVMNQNGLLGWEVFHLEEQQGHIYAYAKREIRQERATFDGW